MEVLYGDVETWYVVFWRKVGARRFTREWLNEWWAYGGYRHVSAFGYSRRANVWVHVNPQPSGLELVLVQEGDEAQQLLATLLQCGSVVKVSAAKSSRFLLRWPFTCVSAISHLIGASSGALTPWGLRNRLLATGTEIPNALLPPDQRSAAEPSHCG